jgi:hypothetical protein
MKNTSFIQSRIKTLPELLLIVNGLKAMGKTVVFTNGVFDLSCTKGHIASLSQAAAGRRFPGGGGERRWQRKTIEGRFKAHQQREQQGFTDCIFTDR